MSTYIRTTQDGRVVEVIGSAICLAGKPEAECLLPVIQHPNWRAILAAAPDATHMAGRLALTVDEAECAQRAMDAARQALDPDPAALAERTRRAVNEMLMRRSED